MRHSIPGGNAYRLQSHASLQQRTEKVHSAGKQTFSCGLASTSMQQCANHIRHPNSVGTAAGTSFCQSFYWNIKPWIPDFIIIYIHIFILVDGSFVIMLTGVHCNVLFLPSCTLSCLCYNMRTWIWTYSSDVWRCFSWRDNEALTSQCMNDCIWLPPLTFLGNFFIWITPLVDLGIELFHEDFVDEIPVWKR